MTAQLLFAWDGAWFALDALTVREIFWLPALSPVEEAPPFVAGSVNWRGKLQPVIDLDLRFGHPPRPYRTSDCVVMLEAEGTFAGIVVEEALDLADIAEGAVAARREALGGPAAPAHCILGEAALGERTVLLLDPTRLIRAQGTGPSPGQPALACRRFWQDAGEEALALFHARSRHVMQAAEEIAAMPAASAVLEIGDELLSVPVEHVREFAPLRGLTPIPGCPPHIAGYMNLRGEILPLLDIRPLLQLGAGHPLREVMVVEFRDVRAGIAVSRVLDVTCLRPDDISPLPAALSAVREQYGHAVARHGGRVVCMLDLPRLLSKEGLAVEEDA